MSDNIVIGGPPNYCREGVCAIAGTAVFAGGLPEENLFDPNPSNPAQITTLDPAQSLYFDMTASAYGITGGSSAGLAGLAGIGVVPPSIREARKWGSPIAKMRMAVSNTGVLAGPAQTRNPDTLVAVTGFTGVVGDVDDDPYSPDANKLTWSGTGTPDAVTLGFQNPTQATVGPHMQCFAVRLECRGTGACRVTLSLYESGSAVAGVDSKVVWLLTGETAVVLFTFDVAALAAPSGNNAQLRIVTTSTAAVGVDIHAARWYVCNDTIGIADFDSGWVDLFPADAFLGDEAGDIQRPAVSRAWVLPEAVRVAGWRYASFGWWIESGAVADPFTPAYLNLGAGIVMGTLQPQVNFSASGGLGVDDRSIAGNTLGGQQHGAIRRPRRTADLSLENLTLAEAAALYTRLDFGSGLFGPLYVQMWPDTADPRHHLGQFYCTLRETSGIGLRTAPERMRRNLRLIEKV